MQARGAGAQVRAAEASGWQVKATSIWVALRTVRVCEERVKTERDSKRNGYGWGGGKKQGRKNDKENRRIKRWYGRARLKSKNERRFLGLKWSIYEVGTPPPHNSEKLVDWWPVTTITEETLQASLSIQNLKSPFFLH